MKIVSKFEVKAAIFAMGLIAVICMANAIGLLTVSLKITSSGSISSVSSLLPLHVNGQWIVDSNGNRIQLRGCATSFDDYGNTALRTTEIQQLQETGCNCVRLVFQFTGGDQYDSTDLQNAVSDFGSSGIYCILCDMDNYGSSSNSILPNSASTWLADWVSISTIFKNSPYVAIYELMNEPYAATASQMEPYYVQCIQAIRANGDNHICMCYDGDFTSPSQLAGLTNVMFDEHDLSTGSAFNDDPSGIGGHDWFPEFTDLNGTDQYISAEIYASEWVANLIEFRSEFNAPDLMGEIEVYNYNMGTPDAYFNSLLINLDEQYGISWSVWWLYGFLTGQYGSNGPTYWTTFCSTMLGGAFTSNYVSSSVSLNQTYSYEELPPVYSGYSDYPVFSSFNALPFNIWQKVNVQNSQFWQIGTGVTFVDVPDQSVTSIQFAGPCELYVQNWATGAPVWGTEGTCQVETLASGQTLTVTGGENGMSDIRVYAWSNTIYPLTQIN